MSTKPAISSTLDSFLDVVISPFNVAVKGKSYKYIDYLSLPPGVRVNDEADVVDVHFTELVLEWLGFHKSAAHYKYNTTTPKSKVESQRPDFVALGPIGTAFIWEDKNTTEEFDEVFSAKLGQYTAGTTGYAVWSNAKRIIGFRFDAKGHSEPLVDMDIKLLVECLDSGDEKHQAQLNAQISALELFFILFSRERFAAFDSLLNKICVDENTYLAQAKPLTSTDDQTQFINGARQVLDHLRLSALQSIERALRHLEEIPNRELSLRQEWVKSKTLFEKQLSSALTEGKKQSLKTVIENMELKLGVMGDNEVSVEYLLKLCQEKSAKLPSTDRSSIQLWVKNAKSINGALRKLRLESSETRRIVDAFQVWGERQLIANLASPSIFAEQVAYVIFVRLLLARILEDKGLLGQRIASDGGVTAWRQIVDRYLGAGNSTIHADSFLSLLSESLSRYYRHFFQQPVFDWFRPDDYFLVEALEFLSRYNFKAVESDLLGFTYEEYVDRVARNKKGHFLTRPEVVDYMLNSSGYQGNATLGRRFLDPSCGSGSFIVHALRRYREALIAAVGKKNNLTKEEVLGQEASRLEVAQNMVGAAVDLFYGMDIDPFPCYLAELNMLIQLLEDLHFLWQKKLGSTIERFHIYITDSLALPESVLSSTMAAVDHHDFPRSIAEEVVDETFIIKAKSGDYASGFSYVIGNPPYVNRRQEQIEENYADYPFFKEALGGDTNTYLLFLRLGTYYLSPGGTLCFIVPLTLLGDISSKSIRNLLTSNGFSPFALTRFYTGNVLFPGIDQATSIICAARREVKEIDVAGGNTVAEALASKVTIDRDKVVNTSRTAMLWRPWLVSPDSHAYHTWEQALELPVQVSLLLNDWFEPRQGDLNATHANPFRIGIKSVLEKDEIPVFKGASISRYSVLPAEIEDVLKIKSNEDKLPSEQSRVNEELHRILSLSVAERGIVIRQVARLNTRYELIATYFERAIPTVFAFENSLWRFKAKPTTSMSSIKAFLAILCSRATSYLLNLFSTNNHVSMEELGAIPMPSYDTMPEKKLSLLGQQCLDARRYIETQFLIKYKMESPETGKGLCLIPSKVLEKSHFSTISLNDAVLLDLIEVKASGKIGTLIKNKDILLKGSQDFNQSAQAMLSTVTDLSWSDALVNLRLPEPSASSSWLEFFNKQYAESAQKWKDFISLQDNIDDVIFDWYGFDTISRDDIRKGLPWATRQIPYNSTTI